MARRSQPSDAQPTKFPVQVPETNGQPDRAKLSNLGNLAVDEILIDIYFNQYLMDGDENGAQGDYLVHSAELSCTNSGGVIQAFLRLEEKNAGYGRRKIGYGAMINGLPQAVKNDAKAGTNIDSFGDCKLLTYEDADIQRSIISAAKGAGSDVCAYIRNLNAQWTTPLESGLMDIGGIKAINMNSVLMCNPIKIQAYLSSGLNGGKIQAVDSGQGNLDNLLKEYKTEYDTAILSAINAKTSLFTTFTMQMINEFIYLYEIRYPERERAFYIFIKEVDDQFSEYIMKIKCMTYMLEDRVARKMTEIMGGSDDIHLEMFMNANPSGGPNAYFIRESSEKSKIMYYDVINRGNSFPPYKSFFHEFGHAIDNLAEDGTGYYSVKFVSTQTVDEKQLKYNYQAKAYYVETQKNTYTKTIHQWTELDLRNYLAQLVYDCMKGQKGALSTQCPQFFQLDTKKQYDIAMYVINELFLFWDGAKKASTLSNISETKALYSEAFTAAKSEVGSYDIFGGLTGEQIGSGHGINYWFDNTGQRITDISKEAFAGFFEYMVLHPVPSARASFFDPNGSMPCAIQAMKEMLNLVV